MHLCDILELSVILFDLGLRKTLLLVSCMIDIRWRVCFEGHQCIVNDCSLASLSTLAREVREGCTYMLLVDLVELIYSTKRLEEPSIFEEA